MPHLATVVGMQLYLSRVRLGPELVLVPTVWGLSPLGAASAVVAFLFLASNIRPGISAVPR